MWIGRWSHGVAMEAEAVTSLTTTSGWGAHHGLLLRHEHVHVHADGGRWVVIFCGRAPSGVACRHLLVHKHAEEGLKVTAHHNMRMVIDWHTEKVVSVKGIESSLKNQPTVSMNSLTTKLALILVVVLQFPYVCARERGGAERELLLHFWKERVTETERQKDREKERVIAVIFL